MQTVEGQPLGTCGVQPVKPPCYSQTTLVEVNQMGLQQLALDLALARLTSRGHGLIGISHKCPSRSVTIEVTQ